MKNNNLVINYHRELLSGANKEFEIKEFQILNGLAIITSEDKEDLNVKNGEYYASTGLLVIPATGLAAGNHLLKIYVVQDTVRTLAVDTVISFIE